MADNSQNENIEISKFVFQSQLKDGKTPSNTTLVIPDIPTQQRDISLGQYMDCFSHLESALSLLLWRFLYTDMQTSNIVFYEVGMRQVVSLLRATSRSSLNNGDQEKLEALIRRIDKCTTKRNHIVHGRWIPELSVGSKNGSPFVESAEWVRSYTPTDPKEATASMDKTNQKTNSKYHFTIPKIIDASRHLVSLSDDISDFSKTLGYLPEPLHSRSTLEPQE